MRKLVTVQTISDLQPIANADSLELASVLGWRVVVRKGIYKVGDTSLFFEIDSFLPCTPEFEFLRKGCYKKLADGTEGFRLKTIRLRGTLSQGLLMPLFEFDGKIDFSQHSIGDEVTDLLGVVKYEPPVPASLAGTVRGNFPAFLQKTDQERIQNLFDDYTNRYRDVSFECTLKLDGTSATFYHRDGDFGVCSRNLDLKESEENTYWQVANSLRIQDILRILYDRYKTNYALQGEIIGEGICGNKEKVLGHKFYLFDIFNIDEGRYLTPGERKLLLSNNDCCYELLHVPVMDRDSFPLYGTTLEDILEMANGRSLNSDIREGIVFKSNVLIDGRVVSFKAISNKFLEKYD